jgi:hypothetical protein
MNTWPSIISPDYGLSEDCYIPQIRTEFEANYVQSRRRATRAVRRWALEWSFLPESQYQTLETFFNANQGSIFYWTHPVTNVTYECRFSEDKLKSDINLDNYRKVNCTIEAV